MPPASLFPNAIMPTPQVDVGNGKPKRIPGTANSVQPRNVRSAKRSPRSKKDLKPAGHHTSFPTTTPVRSTKGTDPGDENLCLSGDDADSEEYNVFSGGDEVKELDECVKQRKFAYFQSDDGRPAEMYRTDLIHRIRTGEFFDDDNSDDESGDVKMAKLNEKWREEWSTGVQVPVSHIYPDFRCAPCEIESTSATTSWTMPKRRIGKKGKKYVAESTHEVADMPSMRLYEGDRLDELWLSQYNNSRVIKGETPVPVVVLLNVMNELEIDCYKNIHAALLEPIHSPSQSVDDVDEDAACDICKVRDCDQDDEMVFCDGCNMCVHLSCYGLPEVPADDWMCTTCVLCYGRRPPCILCPNVGGAMKCTKGTDQWAHIVCALYIPECRFGDVEMREPITAIEEIPDERWKLRCSICDTRQGACIQCSVKSCTTAFHVSCAQRSGLEMRIEQEPIEDSVNFITLCERHSHADDYKQDELSGEIKRIEGKTKPVDSYAKAEKSNELCRMENHFYVYVSSEEITKRLNLNPGLVSDIYEYWKLKRHQKGGGALVNNAHDEILVEVKDPGGYHIGMPTLSLPGGSSSADADDLSALPTNSGYKKWAYGFGRLFKDVDMFRNLCFLQVKREKDKKKRNELDMKALETVFEMVGSNGGYCPPTGQRQMEYLKTTLESMMTPEMIELARSMCDNEEESSSTPSEDSVVVVPSPGSPTKRNGLRDAARLPSRTLPTTTVSPTKSSGGDSNKEQLSGGGGGRTRRGTQGDHPTILGKLGLQEETPQRVSAGRKRVHTSVPFPNGVTLSSSPKAKRLRERNSLGSPPTPSVATISTRSILRGPAK